MKKYITRYSRLSAQAATIYAAAYCSVAQAQVSTGGTTAPAVIQMILSSLKEIGIGVATIALMFCAFGMMFQGKTWKDVSMVAVGGIIFGSAAYIAGLVTGSST